MTALVLAGSGLRARSKAGMAALVAVVALAALAITAGLAVAESGARLVDARAREMDVADVIAWGHLDGLATVSEDPAFARRDGPLPATWGDLLVDGTEVDLVLYGAGPEPPAVSTPLIRSGRWLQGPGEVVLETSLARELGLGPGQAVTVRQADREVDLTVVGTAIDLTDCLYPQCDPGRTFVDPATVEELIGGPATGGMILAALSEPDQAEQVGGELLRRYGDVIDDVGTWPDTRGDLLAVDRVFSGFLAAFGVIVLIATALVVAGSMVARMVSRRREIGLQKALGASPNQVTASLVVEHLVLGAVGVVIGWLVGSLLAPTLQIGLADTLGEPGIRPTVGPLLASALVVGVILLLATALPAWRAGRQPATEVLREEQDVSSGPVARLAGRTGGPASIGLGLLDVAARPLRSAIAVGAVAVAIASAIVAIGLMGAVQGAVDHPERAGDPWDVVVVRDGATTSEVERALATTAGVETWYSQVEDRGAVEDVTFLVRGVGGPAGAAGFVLGAGRAPSAPDEALAGYGLLRRLDLDVGDSLDLEVAGQPTRVRIVGWYRDTEDSGEILVVPLDAFRQRQPDVEPEAWFVSAGASTTPADLAERLVTALGTSATVEAYEADDDLGPFIGAVILVTAIVVLVVVAHLISTNLVSAREQARGLGVMRAVGLTDAQLLGQSALGGLVIAALAVVVGVPVGVVTMHRLSDLVTSSIGIGPDFATTPSAAQLAVPAAVALVVCAVIAAAAAHTLLRRPTSELIRYE